MNQTTEESFEVYMNNAVHRGPINSLCALVSKHGRSICAELSPFVLVWKRVVTSKNMWVDLATLQCTCWCQLYDPLWSWRQMIQVSIVKEHTGTLQIKLLPMLTWIPLFKVFPGYHFVLCCSSDWKVSAWNLAPYTQSYLRPLTKAIFNLLNLRVPHVAAIEETFCGSIKKCNGT